MSTTLIDEYEVMYSSNKYLPRISLKSAGKYIAQLLFYPNATTVFPDAQNTLCYHLDDFHNVIDLLRNEKPMYLLWAGVGIGFENGVKTTAEPVGEAEK